ncbi:MAG: glycosyltransferase family 2 protein [Candidatus Eisenbacteria bacterium]|jgi:cellulose synthase/poly-beta-1,6-N-acetylglucosamine synthase-like glycosyltransferase|nr:glycosyltransferase family 2 protein [Candidatus Eisenbacteria bacterium]
METLLLVSVLLTVYAYAGYPVCITVIGWLRNKRVMKDARFEPAVAFVIPAHNEERVIREKIENTLSLDYPLDKLSVVVVSDASTDCTDAIVREYAPRGVRLERLPCRGGKTRALNTVVPQADTDIVVLCDANVMFDRSAVRYLVSNFADEEVGCVCGRKIYRNSCTAATARGERLYWRLEEYLKRCESLSGSVAGADGAIYAIRRELFRPVQDELSDDFLISLNVYAQGYRIVSEPLAVAFESTTTVAAEEFRRKNRIVATAIRTLVRHAHLLSPFHSGLMAWRIWSHKVLRWMVPFFLIAFAVSVFTLMARGTHVWLGMATVGFLAAGLVGGMLQFTGKRSRLFSLPFYFLLVNAAALVGWVKTLTGRVHPTWNKAESSRE